MRWGQYVIPAYANFSVDSSQQACNLLGGADRDPGGWGLGCRVLTGQLLSRHPLAALLCSITVVRSAKHESGTVCNRIQSL